MRAAKRWLAGALIIALALAGGAAYLLFGESTAELRRAVITAALPPGELRDVRTRLMLEHPGLLAALSRGGAFGGVYSRAVAQDIFGRSDAAQRDIEELLEIIPAGPRSWFLRMPIVNAALFETDAGLVLVDTGVAAASPVLLAAARRLSDKPLHTIVYTHGHVDHAYGGWAFLEAGETPQIIAHENLPRRFERYLRLPRSLAKYMSQPIASVPTERDQLVWPTRTFRDRLELDIGGERLVLVHHRGETDDHLYAWWPDRKILASGDLYQGFLPNAGNGKRVQRHVEEWVIALREMAALGATTLLPGHGAMLRDPALIRENFTVLADALQSLVEQTLAGLEAGLRKDEIYRSVRLEPRFAEHPTLNVQYVTAQDIAKMVLKQYTGWWDDIPSHWSPAPMESEAREVVALAGGVERWVARARELLDEDLALASQLIDWANFAAPEHPDVQQLVIDGYARRVMAPDSNTMEMLVYLDAMTEARARQLQREAARSEGSEAERE